MQLRFRKPTGFRLAAALEFYRGFTPGSGMAAAATDDALVLAFGLDGTHAPVAVALREAGDAILARCEGRAEELVLRAQLARILGLDADGAAWRAIGERDPVIGGLQRSFPGFFTAAKASPYDAATWAVIAPRMGMQQAARIKAAIALEHGAAIALDGRVHHVFPAPAVLATLTAIDGRGLSAAGSAAEGRRGVIDGRGLSAAGSAAEGRRGVIDGLAAEKVARLRGVALAALAGRLDAARLRGLGEDRALTELQELRGVGPWAASHIYYRGAAPVDGLPTAEPRVLHGLALAYGIEKPSQATFARIAEGWRPFRMWVAILLSRHLARSDGWHAPELARERAEAGKQLTRRRQPYTR